VEYVRTQSIAVDARIVVATLSVLLSGAGAEGHPVDDPLVTEPEPDDGATDPGAEPDPGAQR
jgi:hypothetical protein